MHSNRKLLALLLNKKGIQRISFAEDGQAAVEMIAQQRAFPATAAAEKEKGNDGRTAPRLIFIDNTMPRMTGIEATQRIRRLGFRQLMIGVTGNSMVDELRDFLRAGADLAITKPMRPNVLDLLLQFVLDQGSLSLGQHSGETGGGAGSMQLLLTEYRLQWVSAAESSSFSKPDHVR